MSLGLYTYHGDNKLLWYKIIVHKYMPIHPYRMSKRNKQLDIILYKLVYCSNACLFSCERCFKTPILLCKLKRKRQTLSRKLDAMLLQKTLKNLKTKKNPYQ